MMDGPLPNDAHGVSAGRMLELEDEADLARCGRLKDYWYVACLARDLGRTRPLARTIFGLPIALFRDEHGVARAVRDRCLHRATALSRGVVVDGRLCCPYHGWSYDGGGRCTHIPSLGTEQRGAHLRLVPEDVGCLTSFATREQDGLVYVHLGQGAAAQEPFRVPYWGAPGWVVYFMVTHFRNGVTNLVENFMDVPHTVFVHSGWFRKKAQRRVPATVERKDGSVLVTYEQERDQLTGLGRIMNPAGVLGGGPPMVHTDKFYVPNVTRVDYTWGTRAGFIITSQCTPESALSTWVTTAISYRLPLDLPRSAVARALRPVMHWYTTQVITQDVRIMDAQRVGFAGPEPVMFSSTEADVLHAAIESYRGWLVHGGERPADATTRIVFHA